MTNLGSGIPSRNRAPSRRAGSRHPVSDGHDRRHQPEAYLFNDDDFRRFHDWQWFMPVRLAEADGTLAQLWRESRGSAAIKVLVVHLLHTRAPGDGEGWTGWWSLTQTRVGALAGIDRGTVSAAYDCLVEAGLAHVRPSARRGKEGGHPLEVQLSSKLFRQGAEPFVMIPASLIYGGIFAIMSAAEAQLYLTLCGRDAIKEEDSYAEAMEASADGAGFATEDDRRERLTEVRTSAPPAYYSTLERCSGLSATAVKKARRFLLTPLPLAILAEPILDDFATSVRAHLARLGQTVRRPSPSPQALVTELLGADGCAGPRWYTPCRALQSAQVRSPLLTDSGARRQLRTLVLGEAQDPQTPGTFPALPRHIPSRGEAQTQHTPRHIPSIAQAHSQHLVERQRSYPEEKPELLRRVADVRSREREAFTVLSAVPFAPSSQADQPAQLPGDHGEVRHDSPATTGGTALSGQRSEVFACA